MATDATSSSTGTARCCLSQCIQSGRIFSGWRWWRWYLKITSWVVLLRNTFPAQWKQWNECLPVSLYASWTGSWYSRGVCCCVLYMYKLSFLNSWRFKVQYHINFGFLMVYMEILDSSASFIWSINSVTINNMFIKYSEIYTKSSKSTFAFLPF